MGSIPAHNASEFVEISGLNVPVEVRRHPKARRLTLRIRHGRPGLVLTVPTTCPLAEAIDFAERNADWARTHLDAVPAPVHLRHGAELPVRGDLHRLSFTGPSSGRGVVWTQDRRVGAGAQSGPGRTLCVAGRIEHAPRRLTNWLIDQAAEDLSARVHYHACNLGLKPRRITIRDQTSRWGSCSSRGALSFSWRLILAPSDVLDYVAAHEVAHLQEMNHSDRFWALVRATMPTMDRHRNWLRVHGAELHRYVLE